MSALGTLIDQTGAKAFSGVVQVDLDFATHVHSLPSNPEMVHLQVLSVATVGMAEHLPYLFSPGGNASVATVGRAGGSVASLPDVAYEATSFIFHSTMR